MAHVQAVFTKPAGGPLIGVVCAFAVGIVVARAGGFSLLLCWVLVVLLAAVILLVRHHLSSVVVNILLLCLFFLAGILHANSSWHPPSDPSHLYNLVDSRAQASLIGVLKHMPKISGNRTRLLMEVEQIRFAACDDFMPTIGLLQLAMNGRPGFALVPGQRFMVRAALKQPGSFKTPGAFNYQEYLAERSIWLTGWIGSPVEIIRLHQLYPASFIERIKYMPEAVRQQAGYFLERVVVDEVVRGFYKAILIGDRSLLSEQTLENFKAAGVFHLLAISGMHLGLLALLVMTSLGWLFKRSGWLILHLPLWKVTAAVSLLPLAGYALMAGLQPPVVRAFIMVMVFVVAIVLDRQWSLLNNIAIAALVILVLQPTALYSVSFQLSFAAISAIGLFYPQIDPLIRKIPDRQTVPLLTIIKQWVLGSLAVSVIAMLGTAPFLLFYFNRISLLSPVATLLVAPLLCLWALPFGIVALVLMFVWPEAASVLLSVGAWGIKGSNLLINFLGQFTWATLWLPTPTGSELLAYFVLVLGLAGWYHYKAARVFTLASLCCLLLLPALAITKKNLSSQVKVSFLDIGQGSSTLLQMPCGYAMLVDGGGPRSETFNIGTAVIAPFLWRNRLRRLDGLVISHPHADHYNGLFFILERFKPSVIWVNSVVSREASYNQLLKLASELGIMVKVPGAGDELFSNGQARLVNLAALHLPAVHDDKDVVDLSVNDQSLVLRFDYGEFSFLFPGDIEEAAERRILLKQRNLDVDVLLAPHHGSRTSASAQFIEAVSPEYIVVSAGPFRADLFPDPAALCRWRAERTTVFITAQDGTTSFLIDDNRMYITTYAE